MSLRASRVPQSQSHGQKRCLGRTQAGRAGAPTSRLEVSFVSVSDQIQNLFSLRHEGESETYLFKFSLFADAFVVVTELL